METEARRLDGLCRRYWSQVLGSHGVPQIDAPKCKNVLDLVFKELPEVACPNDRWFKLVFQNFDEDGDGKIMYDDLVEIVVQYYEAAGGVQKAAAVASKTSGYASAAQSDGLAQAAAVAQGNGAAAASTAPAKNAADTSQTPEVVAYGERIQRLCLQAFRWVDPDGTGFINQTQNKTGLTFVFTHMEVIKKAPTDSWYDAVFRNFDEDSDGLIEYDDMVEIAVQYLDVCLQQADEKEKKEKVASSSATTKPEASLPQQTGQTQAQPRLSVLDRVKAAVESALRETVPGVNTVSKGECRDILMASFQLLPEVPRPPMEWCNLAFDNYDENATGMIASEDVVDLLEQYVEMQTQAGKVKEPGVPASIPESIQPQKSSYPNSAISAASEVSVPAPSSIGTSMSRSGTRDSAASWGLDSRRKSRMSTRMSSRRKSRALILPEAIATPTYNDHLQIFDDYEFLEKKGEGAFGKVMEVKHKRTGQMRACKSITIRDRQQMELIQTEVRLMKELDHPNVLRLYQMYYDGNRNIYLVIELCKGGSLFERVAYHSEKLKKPMTEAQAARYLRDILTALQYCHDRHIVHRDIKPDNLLFVTRKADSLLKVIDFGLSDFLEKIEAAAFEEPTAEAAPPPLRKRRNTLHKLFVKVADKTPQGPVPVRKVMPRAGTPHYMAPEMHGVGIYTEKCDIFACGIILFQMLTGIHPFFILGQDTGETSRHKIIAGRVDYNPAQWNYLSPLAKQLTQRLLESDPDKRLSGGSALEHAWFKSARKLDGAGSELQRTVFDGLRDFQQYNKLKQATLRLLAKELEEDQVTWMRQQFINMDADGNGVVTLQELIDGARKAGAVIEDWEIRDLAEAMDTSGEGASGLRLGYCDFIASIMDQRVKMEQAQLWEIFNRFCEPSGYITAFSLQNALGNAEAADDTGRSQGRRSTRERKNSIAALADITPEELDQVFEEAGAEDKLRISFNAFCAMCGSQS